MFFGILSLIFVGLTWSLIGVVMGSAPKQHLDTSLIQMFGAFISGTVGMTIFWLLPRAECSWKIWLLTCGVFFVGGLINFIMLQVMSYAMTRGPNGVIWSLVQSALILPFLTGVVFFNNALTLPRILGMTAILTAIVLFAIGKDTSTEKRNGWKKLTILAFILAGIVLNLNNTPSYFREADNVSSLARTCAGAFGTLMGAVVWNLAFLSPRKIETIRSSLHNLRLWKYIMLLPISGLFTSWFLMYPGMNSMAKAGAGALSYPLMISSCIFGFNIYSILLLREKLTSSGIAGTLLCLVGSVMICF